MKIKVVRRFANGKPAVTRKVMEASDIKGRYFTFDVNYGGEDVFPYYFQAKSARDVSLATGVDMEYIFEMSKREVLDLIRRRKHIDRVVRGRLVESEVG